MPLSKDDCLQSGFAHDGGDVLRLRCFRASVKTAEIGGNYGAWGREVQDFADRRSASTSSGE
jgi:hypothetical protein